MTEPRDAYKVLQVDPEADLDVIQAAYRRLAQKYHPDRASTTADPAGSAARMVEINRAWDELRDPLRRAAYDRRRAAAATAGQGSGAPSGADTTWRPTTPAAPTRAQGPTARPATPPPDRPSRPASTNFPDATGSAGPPPGRPAGSVLNFGRYAGWSLGEVGRVDPAYLEWLDRMPIGRPYRAELDVLLRKLGRRLGEQAEAAERHGLFRRR